MSQSASHTPSSNRVARSQAEVSAHTAADLKAKLIAQKKFRAANSLSPASALPTSSKAASTKKNDYTPPQPIVHQTQQATETDIDTLFAEAQAVVDVTKKHDLKEAQRTGNQFNKSIATDRPSAGLRDNINMPREPLGTSQSVQLSSSRQPAAHLSSNGHKETPEPGEIQEDEAPPSLRNVNRYDSVGRSDVTKMQQTIPPIKDDKMANRKDLKAGSSNNTIKQSRLASNPKLIPSSQTESAVATTPSLVQKDSSKPSTHDIPVRLASVESPLQKSSQASEQIGHSSQRNDSGANRDENRPDHDRPGLSNSNALGIDITDLTDGSPRLKDVQSWDQVTDLADWLEITGYHDVDYRKRTLRRHQDMLELDALRARLVREAQEDNEGRMLRNQMAVPSTIADATLRPASVHRLVRSSSALFMPPLTKPTNDAKSVLPTSEIKAMDPNSLKRRHSSNNTDASLLSLATKIARRESERDGESLGSESDFQLSRLKTRLESHSIEDTPQTKEIQPSRIEDSHDQPTLSREKGGHVEKSNVHDERREYESFKPDYNSPREYASPRDPGKSFRRPSLYSKEMSPRRGSYDEHATPPGFSSQIHRGDDIDRPRYANEESRNSYYPSQGFEDNGRYGSGRGRGRGRGKSWNRGGNDRSSGRPYPPKTER